jgi:hypothetical protein
MKIIVRLAYQDILSDVKKCVAVINPRLAEEIVYTTDADVVLSEVAGDFPVFVVSGQVFDKGGMPGTELAGLVKNINHQALFFIYSITPENGIGVDGFIKKNEPVLKTGKYILLTAILASKLDGITPESLKESFPTIELT